MHLAQKGESDLLKLVQDISFLVEHPLNPPERVKWKNIEKYLLRKN